LLEQVFSKERRSGYKYGLKTKNRLKLVQEIILVKIVINNIKWENKKSSESKHDLIIG
jgi:hypothetical protein